MSINAIDFNQKQELENWIIVNDTVMGGRSNATVKISKQYLEFSGELSLENNGGFASTRRVHAPMNWSGTNHQVQITLIGDGRNYQFRLRSNSNVDGIAYVAEFETKAGERSTIRFNLDDFVAQFRGRIVNNAPSLTWEDVSQIGFMLADKRPGNFMLKIEHIDHLPANTKSVAG